MSLRRRAQLALILALMTFSAGSAGAASTDDLAGLTNREYVEYVRDRFEWLTGEARSGNRLAQKFKRECRATPNNDPDAERACEISRAAQDQNQAVLREARDLMSGLQKRLGGVPPWARHQDALLHQAVGLPPRGSESTATATAPKTVTSSVIPKSSSTSNVIPTGPSSDSTTAGGTTTSSTVTTTSSSTVAGVH